MLIHVTDEIQVSAKPGKRSLPLLANALHAVGGPVAGYGVSTVAVPECTLQVIAGAYRCHSGHKMAMLHVWADRARTKCMDACRVSAALLEGRQDVGACDHPATPSRS